VPLRHAAIGGALVALFFEVGQEVFAEATTFFPSYQLIYGAFAAVPLFLMWLYISWLVILLGAEIVYLQGAGRWVEEDEQACVDDALGLRILALSYEQQTRGEGLSFLALKTFLQSQSVDKINHGSLVKTLHYLVSLKLLIEQGNGQYFLVRDLGQYSLYDYLQHIAPKKWFHLIAADLKSATLDLFELEQVLLRQQSNIQKNLSLPLQDFLVKPSSNKEKK
jgi:membrane protein